MTQTGYLGGRWRAGISPCGDLEPPDGAALRWYVAADDRWHVPATESAVRQHRIEGTPVTETRLRIPGGDAVQRVWTVPDHGGMTFVEVHNASPLPIAVAFSRPDLWVPRPPSDLPAVGITLPQGAVTFPVGHAASVTVGLAHDGSRGILRANVPTWQSVVEGWRRTADRASRLVLPEQAVLDDVRQMRCDLALGLAMSEVCVMAGDAKHDDIQLLVAAGELARMGLDAGEDGGLGTGIDTGIDLGEIAAAVERVLRSARRGDGTDHDADRWPVAVAVRGAAAALRAAGEPRALTDLDRAVRLTNVRLANGRRNGRRSAPLELPGTVPAAPAARPDGVLVVPWVEQRLVGSDGDLLPLGFPEDWLGAPIEAHGVLAGTPTTPAIVSFAVRWHGARPAVLWEVEGASLGVRASLVAPGWSGTGPRGEALWPDPRPVDA